MAYKRKYRKGKKIESLDALVGEEFVFVFDKITHCGWFSSWQLRWAKRMIDRGALFFAVKEDGSDGRL